MLNARECQKEVDRAVDLFSTADFGAATNLCSRLINEPACKKEDSERIRDIYAKINLVERVYDDYLLTMGLQAETCPPAQVVGRSVGFLHDLEKPASVSNGLEYSPHPLKSIQALARKNLNEGNAYEALRLFLYALQDNNEETSGGWYVVNKNYYGYDILVFNGYYLAIKSAKKVSVQGGFEVPVLSTEHLSKQQSWLPSMCCVASKKLEERLVQVLAYMVACQITLFNKRRVRKPPPIWAGKIAYKIVKTRDLFEHTNSSGNFFVSNILGSVFYFLRCVWRGSSYITFSIYMPQLLEHLISNAAVFLKYAIKGSSIFEIQNKIRKVAKKN
jgi:hypothetical protein